MRCAVCTRPVDDTDACQRDDCRKVRDTAREVIDALTTLRTSLLDDRLSRDQVELWLVKGVPDRDPVRYVARQLLVHNLPEDMR